MVEPTGVFVHPQALVESDTIGAGTRVWAFAHVMKGAVIGRDCNIGDHAFIESGVRVGDHVVIKNGVSIWEGVCLDNHVFIGPNAAFTNDRRPRAKAFKSDFDKIVIQEGASIGANATLIAPITIGRYGFIGSGAVVTRDVPDYGLVYGSPARLRGYICRCTLPLSFDLNQESETRATCSCGLTFQKVGPTVTIVD